MGLSRSYPRKSRLIQIHRWSFLPWLVSHRQSGAICACVAHLERCATRSCDSFPLLWVISRVIRAHSLHITYFHTATDVSLSPNTACTAHADFDEDGAGVPGVCHEDVRRGDEGYNSGAAAGVFSLIDSLCWSVA